MTMVLSAHAFFYIDGYAHYIIVAFSVASTVMVWYGKFVIIYGGYFHCFKNGI